MSVRGSGAEKAGVVVIVPTTAGAIEIMGLRWSPKIPSSRVVLGNETADQCERWTKEYNSLLRPGDPLRTLMGLHESGGYRLVVSAEIDHGRSWMMPISAGHFAAARGEALHNDPSRARLMVWTTGAIDYSQPETARDAKVVENDYHLIGKIDHSRALFAAAAHAGVPVLCVLPKGPDAEKAATVLGKVLGQQPHHVAIASSLADLIAPIEGFLKAGDFQALPENSQPLALYVAPQERTDRTATEEPAPAASQAAEPQASPKFSPTPPSAPPPGPDGTAQASAPLAGATPPPPYGGAKRSGLPTGALIGVGLVALAIGGAYLALGGLGRGGAPTAAVSNPTGQTPQRLASQPRAQPSQSQPSQPQQVQPQQSQPQQVSTQQPQSAQPQTAQQPATQQLTTQQPTTQQPTSAPVARLTLLTAPAGSSCQAQIYQLPPRFTETVVEVPGDKPQFEIDGANLCGVAVSGATFQRGTGTAGVQSLSSANRIIFAPGGQPIAPPALTLAGGAINRIDLKLK